MTFRLLLSLALTFGLALSAPAVELSDASTPEPLIVT